MNNSEHEGMWCGDLFIKKIESPKVELFQNIFIRDMNSDDVNDGFWKLNYIADLNEYELLDVRVQIKEKELKDYVVKFVDKVGSIHYIRIDHKGEMEYYPNGLLDTMTGSLLKLI